MNKPDNSQLWKYAGLVTQFFVAIGLAVFIGLYVDKWLNLKIPVAAWVLPLLAIIGIIVKIMRDTAQKK